MKNKGKIFTILGIILFVVAVVMFYKGYDKMTNYYNSELRTINNHNAYVNGDAYNYIINGNYATGFFVLGMGCFVSGILCSGIATVLSVISENGKMMKMQIENENYIEEDELPSL